MLFSRHPVAVTLLNSSAHDWVFKPSIMATGGLTRSRPSPKSHMLWTGAGGKERDFGVPSALAQHSYIF